MILDFAPVRCSCDGRRAFGEALERARKGRDRVSDELNDVSILPIMSGPVYIPWC